MQLKILFVSTYSKKLFILLMYYAILLIGNKVFLNIFLLFNQVTEKSTNLECISLEGYVGVGV